MIKQIHTLVLLFAVFSLSAYGENTLYNINGVMTISVSDELELRKDGDIYTKWLNNELKCTGKEEKPVVFQQRGLSAMSEKAQETYCRIMIGTITDEDMGFPSAYETDYPHEVLEEFRNMAISELVPGANFISGPYVTKTRSPKGFWLIKVQFTRTGPRGNLNCELYYLFNTKYAARIYCSCLQKDALHWGPIIEKALRSIEWKTIFDDEILPPENSAEVVEAKEETQAWIFDTKFLMGMFLGIVTMSCIFLYAKNSNKNEQGTKYEK